VSKRGFFDQPRCHYSQFTDCYDRIEGLAFIHLFPSSPLPSLAAHFEATAMGCVERQTARDGRHRRTGYRRQWLVLWSRGPPSDCPGHSIHQPRISRNDIESSESHWEQTGEEKRITKKTNLIAESEAARTDEL
jgi:hypothetical protein